MKGVLMTKMIQELNLNNLTPEIDLSDMRSEEHTSELQSH